MRTDDVSTIPPNNVEPYDPVEELKKEIIEAMNKDNPISRLRKDMIRRRAKKLLKMELKHRRRKK